MKTVKFGLFLALFFMPSLAMADSTITICVPTISTATGVSVTSCVPVSTTAPFPTQSN